MYEQGNDKLDLHGVKHQDVQRAVDSFLWKNHDNLPVIIVTGNSESMKKEVINIIADYNYDYRIGDILQINTGYIEVY
tara:strand:- start:2544 stop:2777 length:234 start_codon:yes stop_codon:yes gene_type:complete